MFTTIKKISLRSSSIYKANLLYSQFPFASTHIFVSNYALTPKKVKKSDDPEGYAKYKEHQALKKALPKRSLNPYTFFSKQYFADHKEETKGVPVSETIKTISKEWKALSESARKPFQELAAADKIRAQKEREEYNIQNPRRRLGYNLFVAQESKALPKSEPIGKISSIMSEKWKALSAEEKKVFNDRAQQDRYKADEFMIKLEENKKKSEKKEQEQLEKIEKRAKKNEAKASKAAKAEKQAKAEKKAKVETKVKKTTYK